MKISGLWVSYLVIGTTLMLFFNLSCATTSLSISDVGFTGRSGRMIMAATNRKLKENSYDQSIDEKGDAGSNLNLDDYHPIDPVPSSKASIKPGPIEHGTPLNPFIPKPSPPPRTVRPKKIS